MKLIDTHCHLYLNDFSGDLTEIAARALQQGIDKIFLPAIDSETHTQLLGLAEKLAVTDASTLSVFPLMGLHPCSVKENFEEELQQIQNYLNSSTRFYGIGETGLDFFWDVTFREQQVVSFERQIKWSIERQLPVIIHSRNSTADCIKSVAKFNGCAKGIFHCFGGTLQEAREIVDLGFHLGIGGVLTYKNSGLRDVLKELSLDSMVLETDAPYLTPVPHRGKRNEPSYLALVAQTMAQVFGLSVEEVADITSHNAKSIFGIS